MIETNKIDTTEKETDKQLPWTGERLVTQIDDKIGTIEHLHRYAFAMEYVSNKVIVDIASGEGYGSNLLANVASRVIGVDISQEAVNFASQKYVKPNLEFKLGSADSIPIPDSCIDVVVSFETLEHHEKHDEMMREVLRILKHDGLLIISTPEKAIYHRRDPNNDYHVKELYFDEFNCLIDNYFQESLFLEQKIIFGSLLVAKNNCSTNSNGLEIYSGDFNKIDRSLDISKDILNQPFFYICLASNHKIILHSNSFFDGSEVYEKNELQNRKNIEDLQQNIKFLCQELSLSFGYKIIRKISKIAKKMAIQRSRLSE